MTIKSIKKFTELLNRSEGLSITPIIVVLVVMSIMGGVFTSIMGGWKVSAPLTINSNKAFFQAETAAMFALQDASYRFYGGSFNYGTRGTPYPVITSGTEVLADYWFERPAVDNPALYTDDDDTSDDDDDVVDDDADDAANPTRYTITATGRVNVGGTTTAKRQVKVLADIIRSAGTTVEPGVQTSGVINGTGGGFGMQNDGGTISTSFGVGADNNTGPDPEAGVVIRPAQTMDEYFVKALAIDQGHYNAVDLTIGLANDNYPEPATPSFYYNGTIPNFTYVGQHLIVGSNRKMFGVVWVKGNVVLNGTATMDAIIICEGDITFNGNSDIIGGIIHYGTNIYGNGNPTAITVNDAFFDHLSVSIPIITVQSWQEAVSAN